MPAAGLMREALARHPAVRESKYLRDAADAGVNAAKWQFWPSPSLTAEHVNTTDVNYRGDATVATLRVQQALWTGGRLSGNLELAQARAIQAEAEVEIARQQLALRVLQTWSEAATAYAKVQALERSLETHRRLLGLVERRAQEGSSAQADVALARGRLDGIEADLALARAQCAAALDRLGLWVGHAVATTVLEILPPARMEVNREALLAAARDGSPQLARAQAQLRMAGADVQVARAAMAPEIYIRAERQYGNVDLPAQGPQNRIFVGISSSFGAGLSSQAGVNAARSREQAVLQDIEALAMTLEEQISNDLALLYATQERRQRLARANQSAAEVSASWERQFLAGRKQWQDLMNAAREQALAESQLAEALGMELQLYWRLRLLSQGVDAVLAPEVPR